MVTLPTNSTLEGSQVDVTCHQNVGFKFNGCDNLRIRELKFVGCGNNRALSVKHFIIENSIFVYICSNVYRVTVVNHSTFGNNSTTLSGGVIATDSTSKLTHAQLYIDYSQLISNKAVTGGVLSAINVKTSISNNIFSYNQATESGGVMYIMQSEIDFNGWCNLTDNFARTGGTIFAAESTLFINIHEKLTIMSNMARDSGGGLYLYHSNLNCRSYSITDLSGNRAKNSGGGIHAICLLYTSPSPRDATLSRMPSSA